MTDQLGHISRVRQDTFVFDEAAGVAIKTSRQVPSVKNDKGNGVLERQRKGKQE